MHISFRAGVHVGSAAPIGRHFPIYAFYDGESERTPSPSFSVSPAIARGGRWRMPECCLPTLLNFGLSSVRH